MEAGWERSNGLLYHFRHSDQNTLAGIGKVATCLALGLFLLPFWELEMTLVLVYSVLVEVRSICW